MLSFLLRLKNPLPVQDTVNGSFSFLVVRHPFHRLVSAYRNKLLNTRDSHDGWYFYKTYSRPIVAKYRKSNHTSYENDLESTLMSNVSSTRRDPTFDEFVAYLLDNNPQTYDAHWKPIYLHCNVCLLKYKFILKFEDISNEFKIFSQYLDKVVRFPEAFRIQLLNSSGTMSDTVKRYISSLPVNKREHLIKIYFNDFVLFNYSPSSF